MNFKQVTLLGLLALCSQSYAESLSYNTIAVSVGTIQPSDDDYEDGTGISLAGTVELGDVIYIGAGVSKVNFDSGDQTRKSLGIGAHVSATDTTSLYAQIYGLQVEISNGYYDFDDTGKAITVGLRQMLTDKVELEIGAEHTDVFDETDLVPFAGVHYYATTEISLGLIISKPDDATSYGAMLRVNF